MGETTPERRMIRASFVEEALDCLRRRGLAVAPVLAAADLPEAGLEPVSAERYGRLWLAVAAAMEDEFLGLGARAMRPGSFVLLCRAVIDAGTLERALRRTLRFLDVLLEDPRGELVVADGLAQIVLTDAGPARSAFAYRTYWIILVGIACWLVRRRLPLRLIDFRCSEPVGVADYRSFFGAPVRFDRPISRLAFDAAHLRLPIDRDEKALKQFLRGAPANILVGHRHDAGLAATVRTRLRADAATNWPDFDGMAERLRLTPSSLRHRLRQEGQTWSAIRDAVRHERAMAWLSETRRGVAEIATDLGYAEPSAFHRAFRQWTGRSPAAWRRDAVRRTGGEAG